MNLEFVESLDEACGVGTEALIAPARRRMLLNQVAVGVVREGRCLIWTGGSGVDAQSRFELGSLTKTYTAELLAMLASRGVVRLDEPVSKYLDKSTREEAQLEGITFEDLATHQSGLPRLPPGLPLLSLDPYARYRAPDLDRYTSKRGMMRPERRQYRYSNLGYSLLGYALGRAAGRSYGTLVEEEILRPLGMTDTALALGQEQPSLLQGHKQSGLPTVHWRWDVCAPCGGLCSTIVEQVRWLEWLLQDVGRESLQRRAPVPGGHIGLGWMMPGTAELCWHNGATAGFSSWISLDRERRNGVVILSNRQAIGLVNALGGRLQRCLRGGEADSMGWDYGRAKAMVLDPLSFAVAPLSPVLSPIAALPMWLRLPVAAGLGYGLERLIGAAFLR